MNTRHIALIASLFVLTVVACGKDALPPPAPSVDPIASPTSLAEITVTGTAQYGAKIAISGAAAVAPAQIVADSFTARFQAVVTLAHNATNTLVFTATDGAGRTSAPTTVVVNQSDNYAVSLRNFAVNGVPCAPGGAPPSCAALSGDTIDFELVANSTYAVSEVEYTAFFSTAGGSGTLRSRSVLVAPNSPLPYVQHFTFDVPGGTLLERVPIIGLSVDSQGNRATSPEIDLRVNQINALGRTVVPIAVGHLVSGPNDIALDASGNLFIANDGDGNLLKLSAGSTYPVIFSNYNGRSNFAVADGAGNFYLTDDGGSLFRVNPQGTVVDYLDFGGGLTGEGLTTVARTFAKGLVAVGAAGAGNTVSVGSATYEFQAGGTGCSPSNVCVDLNAANKTQALANAIQASSVEANAVFDTGSGKAVISAKTPGSAGNANKFTTNNASAIALTPSGGNLGEGHDEDLFAGQKGGADVNIYRFPESLTSLPARITDNDGSFPVGTRQLGIALLDRTTATSANLRDLDLYFIDQASTQTLRGFEAVDSAAPAALFGIKPGAAGTGSDLYDVVLLANGCLLVSDQGAGMIYAVDPRGAPATAPTVTTIASGFKRPRGLAVYNGNLYVADNRFDAIVRISPLAAASCF